MQKYLFILSITLSFGSYAISMKISMEKLCQLLAKNTIYDHEEEHNNKECTTQCDRERTKILLEMREIIKKINEKMLDRKVGNKKIEEIKRHWNDEHPKYPISL